MHPNFTYDFSKYSYRFDYYSSAHTFSVLLPFNYMRNKVTSFPYPHKHVYTEFLYAKNLRSGAPPVVRIIPAGVEHATYREENNEALVCYTFCIYISSTVPEAAQKGTGVYRLEVLEGIAGLQEAVTITADIHAQERFDAIHAACAAESAQWTAEKLYSELQLLLVDAARAIPGTRRTSPPPVRAPEELRGNIIEYFLSEYASFSECRKDELATLLSVSDRQLTRILSEIYGKTFRELLLERRMCFARGHENQGTPAEKAAESCGYTSVEAFLNAFRKYWNRAYCETDSAI